MVGCDYRLVEILLVDFYLQLPELACCPENTIGSSKLSIHSSISVMGYKLRMLKDFSSGTPRSAKRAIILGGNENWGLLSGSRRLTSLLGSHLASFRSEKVSGGWYCSIWGITDRSAVVIE